MLVNQLLLQITWLNNYVGALIKIIMKLKLMILCPMKSKLMNPCSVFRFLWRLLKKITW